jgi:hypothetical protein
MLTKYVYTLRIVFVISKRASLEEKLYCTFQKCPVSYFSAGAEEEESALL